jgi:DNA invertase Pin-like site-specific DNA recombinase
MVDRAASRAVMYVRMSTENQDYSTDHQRARIREYAAARDIEIIREYVDDGKSGLDIRRRAGLLGLMQDVQAQAPDFNTILVFDISRWGRFQDIDEAAYHEHTCRRAGIEVIYCGERFANDAGPYASLLKSMKRVMAAEYSRDLSEKVFTAQARFIAMGFKQGGHAGYGLRRLALKACGTPRAILEYGESKISATDRVVLVWGPDHEVATVRRVYGLYLKQGASEAGLARLLNSETVPSEFGRPWTRAMINSLLTNVKYCGALAYNRRSCKLSTRRTRNAADRWIVKPEAVAPIVDADLFAQVQAERARRLRRHSPDELVTLLQSCHDRHGAVNAKIIAADSLMPDPQLLVRTFGSLLSAYEAAGLPDSPKYAFAATKRLLAAARAGLQREVETQAVAAGGTVDPIDDSDTVLINGRLRVLIEIAVPRNPRRGQRNWRIRGGLNADFTIVGRIEPITGAIADYFLFSRDDLAPGKIYLKDSNLDQFASVRYPTVGAMFGLDGPGSREATC